MNIKQTINWYKTERKAGYSEEQLVSSLNKQGYEEVEVSFIKNNSRQPLFFGLIRISMFFVAIMALISGLMAIFLQSTVVFPYELSLSIVILTIFLFLAGIFSLINAIFYYEVTFFDYKFFYYLFKNGFWKYFILFFVPLGLVYIYFYVPSIKNIVDPYTTLFIVIGILMTCIFSFVGTFVAIKIKKHKKNILIALLIIFIVISIISYVKMYDSFAQFSRDIKNKEKQNSLYPIPSPTADNPLVIKPKNVESNINYPKDSETIIIMMLNMENQSVIFYPQFENCELSNREISWTPEVIRLLAVEMEIKAGEISGWSTKIGIDATKFKKGDFATCKVRVGNLTDEININFTDQN